MSPYPHEKHSLLGVTPDTRESKSSIQPPPYCNAKPDSNFAMISFHMTDRIRLIQFSAEDISKITNHVTTNWPGGIQKTRVYDESYELKLVGNPWREDQDERQSTGWRKEASPKRLVQALLSGLWMMGWTIEESIVFTKSARRRDTFLFRKSEQQSPACDWFTISFEDFNRLVIHDGVPEVSTRLHEVFLEKKWSKESTILDRRQDIKLEKAYWLPGGQDTVQARLILLTIADVLDEFGFRIYASVRLTSSSDMLVCKRARE